MNIQYILNSNIINIFVNGKSPGPNVFGHGAAFRRVWTPGAALKGYLHLDPVCAWASSRTASSSHPDEHPLTITVEICWLLFQIPRLSRLGFFPGMATLCATVLCYCYVFQGQKTHKINVDDLELQLLPTSERQCEACLLRDVGRRNPWLVMATCSVNINCI